MFVFGGCSQKGDQTMQCRRMFPGMVRGVGWHYSSFFKDTGCKDNQMAVWNIKLCHMKFVASRFGWIINWKECEILVNENDLKRPLGELIQQNDFCYSHQSWKLVLLQATFRMVQWKFTKITQMLPSHFGLLLSRLYSEAAAVSQKERRHTTVKVQQ